MIAMLTHPNAAPSESVQVDSQGGGNKINRRRGSESIRQNTQFDPAKAAPLISRQKQRDMEAGSQEPDARMIRA